MDGLRLYDGSVAVVTGGASGIGAALCRALHRRGATVVVADLQGELAEQLATELNGVRPNAAEAATVDVRDSAALADLAKNTWTKLGRVDLWFNNAGVGVGGPVERIPQGDWDFIVDVNIRGVIHGVAAAYPQMISQGFGHIINTASVAGLLPAGPWLTPYSMSKHAVVAFSLATRIEAERHGVRVSALCPGVVQTPLLGGGRYGRGSGLDLAKGRTAFESLRPMDADIFAQRVLRAVARNHGTIVVPGWLRPVVWLIRTVPGLSDFLARRSPFLAAIDL